MSETLCNSKFQIKTVSVNGQAQIIISVLACLIAVFESVLKLVNENELNIS